MTDSSPLGDDRELTGMLRRLRFERDQEMAELEDEAERLEAKRSDLPRLAMTAMMAGEPWGVSFGERTFDGHIVHIGDDFVGLTDQAGNLADITYRAIDYISAERRHSSPGRAPTTLRPATFRGRLLGLQEGRQLELGGAAGWSLPGTIESVNVDHLTLTATNGHPTIIPLTSIGFILRRPLTRRREVDRHR